MRPIALGALIGGLACSHPVPVAPAPADASAPSALVKIAAFDCEKYQAFPGEPPPSGPIAPGTGVRAWKGGGPSGSAWNVDQLRCTARATATCTRGKVLFTLRAGQHLLAETESAVSSGAAAFEAVTPAAAWELGYDKPAKAAAKLPFQTAAFRLQAALDCETPPASVHDWSYRFVVADDTFVAGFASGE